MCVTYFLNSAKASMRLLIICDQFWGLVDVMAALELCCKAMSAYVSASENKALSPQLEYV